MVYTELIPGKKNKEGFFMSYPNSIFRVYVYKLTLFSAIIFLLFIQLFVVQNLWAMDSQAISPYQQIMTERNLRLKKLQKFKGDLFKDLLKGQNEDRALLKLKKIPLSERLSSEKNINRHYNKLIKNLDSQSKELETQIYSHWKKSSQTIQENNTLSDDHWNSIDSTLDKFSDNFLNPETEASMAMQILAKHIKTCTPLEQKFTHPFTGKPLIRSVKGFSGENCHYIEQLPGKGQMECFYPKEKRQEIADFYLNSHKYKKMKVKSHTEFIDGQAVTTTKYFVDGKAFYHALNDSMDKGECKITGYNKK